MLLNVSGTLNICNFNGFVLPKITLTGRWKWIYRDRQKSMQILLSRTQAGPGRTGKQEQEQSSCNHVQAF